MTELSRLEIIYEKDNLKKIKESKILIAGLGGVGSYAAEAITRCFVNNIVLIDYDKYDITNLNRQLHSNLLTIGRYKVDIIKENIEKINKHANIIDLKKKLNKDNIPLLVSKDINFVIDAIDDFEAKVDLIEHCYKNDINIISCMGTGNKIKPEKLQYSDIYKTKVCPLARKIRKELRNRNIKKLDVVYSTEEVIKRQLTTTVGSSPFVPATAGLLLASYVINRIIE